MAESSFSVHIKGSSLQQNTHSQDFFDEIPTLSVLS